MSDLSVIDAAMGRLFSRPSLDEERQKRAQRVDAAMEYADLRTTPARIAMRLSNISEMEVCFLIACLTQRIKDSGWGHTEAGQIALERLEDANAVLEEAADLGAEA